MTIEYLIQLRITTEDLQLSYTKKPQEPWPEEVLDRLRQLDYIKEAELLEYAPNTRCDSCQQLKEVEEYHALSPTAGKTISLHVLLCTECWQSLPRWVADKDDLSRLLWARLHPCGCGG